MRLGVIDIGSNTVHLLVVDAYYGAAPVPAHSQKIELRLAQHMGSDGRIDDAAVDELVGFMGEAVVQGEDLGVTGIEAFATSAIREAVNGDEVLEHVRATAGTTFHQTSTCMMGPGPMSVVDTALRVKGLDGLRVIDASVMPTVVSGNTNATVIMIAEKGADMILQGA